MAGFYVAKSGILQVLFCVFVICTLFCDFIHCEVSKESETKPKSRYLLYDVNPGEGFNLRRDVYMRMANLVKLLNEKNENESWTLVLPPWGRLYHWQTRSIEQEKIPWSLFFDLDSLRKHVPVIEFTEYLHIMGEPVIDEIYGLQRYKEGWTSGEWEEKAHFRDCVGKHGFEKDKDGKWRWWFWGYKQVYGLNFRCMSIQMEYQSLVPFILKNVTGRSVFLYRAEEVIHGEYSEWSKLYWTARRSMRFASHLIDIGDKYRQHYLDSNDENDKTVMDEDWRDMVRNHGDAIGGPYLAVHMRRKDYLYGHKKDVPSLKKAADQITEILKAQKLKTVFIATDAPEKEYDEVKSYIKGYKVFRFKPTEDILQKYKDGGVAIIDQWICAHARYFIGTSVSTFSFRIHEEREILGFDQTTTYNRLCGDDPLEPCEQSTKWDIKYEENLKKKKDEL